MLRVLHFAPLLLLSACLFALPAKAHDDDGDDDWNGGFSRDCADDWRYCDEEQYDFHPRYYHSGRYDENGYDGRYYHGHHKFIVCDSDGDRCYRSSRRHWNYRKYYRHHGYRWLD
jgi:hypothetical protein